MVPPSLLLPSLAATVTSTSTPHPLSLLHCCHLNSSSPPSPTRPLSTPPSLSSTTTTISTPPLSYRHRHLDSFSPSPSLLPPRLLLSSLPSIAATYTPPLPLLRNHHLNSSFPLSTATVTSTSPLPLHHRLPPLSLSAIPTPPLPLLHNHHLNYSPPSLSSPPPPLLPSLFATTSLHSPLLLLLGKGSPFSIPRDESECTSLDSSFFDKGAGLVFVLVLLGGEGGASIDGEGIHGKDG